MATLSDENASNIGKSIKDGINALLKFLLRRIIKNWQERAERNFKKLEKKHPERIRTADIETKDLDKFQILAQQQGIKLYQIEQEKHKTPTLKYDIRDEHKIVGIFKQLEEGYKIPENQLMAIMEKHIDTQKLVNRISKVTGLNHAEVEKELKNPEYYQDEKILGKNFQERVQEMYEKGFKEVVGPEKKAEKLNLEATQPQKDLAEKLGISGFENMNRVEISLALEDAGADRSFFRDQYNRNVSEKLYDTNKISQLYEDARDVSIEIEQIKQYEEYIKPNFEHILADNVQEMVEDTRRYADYDGLYITHEDVEFEINQQYDHIVRVAKSRLESHKDRANELPVLKKELDTILEKGRKELNLTANFSNNVIFEKMQQVFISDDKSKDLDIPNQKKDELEVRLEKLKEKREKTKTSDKEKSKQKTKKKVADKGRER